MAKLGYMSGPEYSVLPNPFNVNRLANVTPDRRAKRTPGGASFCSVQRWHPSVPAHASDEPSRGAAVKNGRFSGGRPQGLFLTKS